MAKACQVSETLDSGLTDSEVLNESVIQFSEEEELEQLIDGQICSKIYPFSKGKILVIWLNKTYFEGFFNCFLHLPLMM